MISTSTDIEPLLYADRDVARLTGVARSTLAKMRMTGRRDGPPFIKIGARCLYPADELRQWIDNYRLAARVAGVR